eukprot:11158469-Lingulodinium_polyedra.AAC.1
MMLDKSTELSKAQEKAKAEGAEPVPNFGSLMSVAGYEELAQEYAQAEDAVALATRVRKHAELKKQAVGTIKHARQASGDLQAAVARHRKQHRTEAAKRQKEAEKQAKTATTNEPPVPWVIFRTTGQAADFQRVELNTTPVIDRGIIAEATKDLNKDWPIVFKLTAAVATARASDPQFDPAVTGFRHDFIKATGKASAGSANGIRMQRSTAGCPAMANMLAAICATGDGETLATPAELAKVTANLPPNVSNTVAKFLDQRRFFLTAMGPLGCYVGPEVLFYRSARIALQGSKTVVLCPLAGLEETLGITDWGAAALRSRIETATPEEAQKVLALPGCFKGLVGECECVLSPASYILVEETRAEASYGLKRGSWPPTLPTLDRMSSRHGPRLPGSQDALKTITDAVRKILAERANAASAAPASVLEATAAAAADRAADAAESANAAVAAEGSPASFEEAKDGEPGATASESSEPWRFKVAAIWERRR